MLMRTAISIIMYRGKKSVVGMACQKVHKQERDRGYKSEGKYTKPYPSLHLFTVEWRCRDRALYILIAELVWYFACHMTMSPYKQKCVMWLCDYPLSRLIFEPYPTILRFFLLSSASLRAESPWEEILLYPTLKEQWEEQDQCLEISTNCTAMVINTVLQCNPTEWTPLNSGHPRYNRQFWKSWPFSIDFSTLETPE